MKSGQHFPAFEWLGRQPYKLMWQQMQLRAKTIADEEAEEIIWTCEHDPVYTTGRRGVDNRFEKELPAPFIVTDRGGETTFHGPGQLMLYPVINLRRRRLGVKQYTRLLEQSCIDTLTGLGVPSEQRIGFPGVWTEHGKIAALGIRVSKEIAYHGMALNVSVESRWFATINPCGIGKAATSLSSFCTPPTLCELAKIWYAHFSSRMNT
ncbi:MAG: lipoyl(octanoyl) transferase LipB [Mariprofundaceae bacterium]|nr:lipoyl(octanoyl) transferase LipB [Mariprofundaceae bacterium]